VSPEQLPHFNSDRLEVGQLLLDYTKSIICTTDERGQQTVIPLTANEFRLLEYFMQHPNQILTRDRLLTRLWDVDTDPMSNVVAARIRLLRRKLADYGCDGMIETVHGFGYRLNK
jgi:DNA-binding response OmpR family regulator